MPAARPADDHRPSFLLGQPFWLADGQDAAQRWDLAIREDEPAIEGLQSAIRPVSDAPARGKHSASWKRIDRSQLVRFAVGDEPHCQRIGVVCGAGLGKTTNLAWLEAAVNGLNRGFHRALGYCLELRDLPRDRHQLLESMVGRVSNRVEATKAAIRHGLRRLLAAGRVTFLLDSLDQADPNPKGPVVAALRELVQGVWRRCRVWVSGRPYAFRTARPALAALEPNIHWQFLRIGQLDQPECRQLLETTERPGAS